MFHELLIQDPSSELNDGGDMGATKEENGNQVHNEVEDLDTEDLASPVLGYQKSTRITAEKQLRRLCRMKTRVAAACKVCRRVDRMIRNNGKIETKSLKFRQREVRNLDHREFRDIKHLAGIWNMEEVRNHDHRGVQDFKQLAGI